MKHRALAAIAAVAVAPSAYAAGLDRSNQNVLSIFDDSNTLSFSIATVNPDVTGTDALGASYDVGRSYEQMALTYTLDVSDKLTFGFIADQPYGVDVFYGASPAASFLGGTGADLSSEAYSFVGKYQINPRVSVFGGLKAQTVRATVTLNGLAYRNAIPVAGVTQGFNATLPAAAPPLEASTLGAALTPTNPNNAAAVTAIETTYGAGTTAALGGQVAGLQTAFDADNGYTFNMDSKTEYGWLIGAAYEIPDIALRFAVTYHAEIEYTATTNEQVLGNTVPGTVTYVVPQALNFDFQTGIAKDTLLLASYRWSEYEASDLVPAGLGSDLVNLDNGQRFTIGVGRRFSDTLSGSVILSYEPEGDDDLVSPLGPTNGLVGLTIGGRYAKDNLVVSGGVNYSWLGDAQAEVAGQPVATFEGNSSLALGLKVAFTF